jgi:hypothetical protein
MLIPTTRARKQYICVAEFFSAVERACGVFVPRCGSVLDVGVIRPPCCDAPLSVCLKLDLNQHNAWFLSWVGLVRAWALLERLLQLSPLDVSVDASAGFTARVEQANNPQAISSGLWRMENSTQLAIRNPSA